jgi:hypothetical protein
MVTKFSITFFTFLSVFFNQFLLSVSHNYKLIKVKKQISAAFSLMSVSFRLVNDHYIKINTPAALKTELTVLMVLCVYSAPLYLLNAASLFRDTDSLTALPTHQHLPI